MLFVPGYAALRLVTSYAAPWLRHARISLGSLQTWWSGRAATVRFIETAARFTWKRHGLCSSVSGFLQVDMACGVVDVLADVRSNKIRQETVRLTSSTPSRQKALRPQPVIAQLQQFVKVAPQDN